MQVGDLIQFPGCLDPWRVIGIMGEMIGLKSTNKFRDGVYDLNDEMTVSTWLLETAGAKVLSAVERQTDGPIKPSRFVQFGGIHMGDLIPGLPGHEGTFVVIGIDYATQEVHCRLLSDYRELVTVPLDFFFKSARDTLPIQLSNGDILFPAKPHSTDSFESVGAKTQENTCPHSNRLVTTVGGTVVELHCRDCGQELDVEAENGKLASCPNHWTGGLSGVCPDCRKS